MSNFYLLHPAIQHHIANSLGWSELRPFQDELIPGIIQGEHRIILAPTAGGKTEAALFPLFTRMANENWSGVSILYICPLRALLNNLYERISQYSSFTGHTAGVWHGDISASRKKEMLKDHPSILLTTPESLEGILISPNKNHQAFFSGVQAIVVDEIHSFAGDDRGWHLLFVLNRIRKIAGQEMQRIGLSATVGNPDYLMDWLTVGCTGSRSVYRPSVVDATDDCDISLDYVGSLGNAATVISRIYRSEKRLVFIDSRSKAEQLGHALRELNVDAFVTHGSLSREQRMLSEQAFAQKKDCVIVATSVLELGVDIGSLDRVIQIDSPSKVSGFLQRMGRTGRRPGTTRNCLFLATNLSSMAMAAALVELVRTGFIEPTVAPTNPLHIAAQQMLALSLQFSGCPKADLLKRIREIADFSRISEKKLKRVLDWMLGEEFLFSDGGIVSIGRSGDDEFGRRNFIELVSVFCTPPLFVVRHGRQDIGYVDQMTFAQKRKPPWCILLAGRSWRVSNIDWRRKIAFVEPVSSSGKSRWFGVGPQLSFALCQSYKNVLAHHFDRQWWSQRVKDRMAEMRMEHAWLQRIGTTLTRGQENGLEWWTFGGSKGNATLAAVMEDQFGGDIRYDAFKLSIDTPHELAAVEAAIRSLRPIDVYAATPAVSDDAVDGLKFSSCLPRDFAFQILAERLRDAKAAESIVSQPMATVIASD